MDNADIYSPISVRAVTLDIGDTLVFDRPNRKERLVIALRICGVGFTQHEFDRAYSAAETRGIELYLHGGSLDDQHVGLELVEIVLSYLTANHDKALAGKLLQTYADQPCERYVHPDAIPLLENLMGRGFKLGVISDWESDLPELLEEFAIAGYFESFSISAVVGVTKPNREIFDDCISKLNILPDECLHIGDYYELDAMGAQNAGMQAVLFDSQYRYMDKELPVPTVRTFDDLKTYLECVKLSQ